MKYAGILVAYSLLMMINNYSHAAKFRDDNPRSDPCVREMSNSVKMVNNTVYGLEDLVHWTCNYLDIKNVTICISKQTKEYQEDGFVIKEGDIYFIYLKEDVYNLDLVLVHELIHIKQYESNDLILKDKSTVMYKGNKINLLRIDYDIRPYEIEAHTKDGLILREYKRYKKSLRKCCEDL